MQPLFICDRGEWHQSLAPLPGCGFFDDLFRRSSLRYDLRLPSVIPSGLNLIIASLRHPAHSCGAWMTSCHRTHSGREHSHQRPPVSVIRIVPHPGGMSAARQVTDPDQAPKTGVSRGENAESSRLLRRGIFTPNA